MKDHRITKLDKLLTSVLDKIPDSFGVLLDENGWLKIKDLFFAIKDEEGIVKITPSNIEFYVSHFLFEKYEIDSNKIRIKPCFRTNFLEIENDVVPPPILYICIRERAYDHVLNNGLEIKGDEKPFILTTDRETAIKLGKKISNEPILAEINSEDAANRGIEFLKYGSLYLSYYIPKKFISLPPKREQEISRERHKIEDKIKKEQCKPKDFLIEEKNKKTPITIGSYYMSLKDMLPHLFIENNTERKHKSQKGKDREPSWKEVRREKEKKWK